MDVLVTYDVNTMTKEGRKRLRKVAKICEGYGQRVQWSVFECSLTNAQFERMRLRLLRVIDEEEDSLRIYRMLGGRDEVVQSYGRDHYVDFDEPLII